MTGKKESNTRAFRRHMKGRMAVDELFLPDRERVTIQAEKLVAMVESDVYRRGVKGTLDGGLGLLDEVLNALGEDARLRYRVTQAAYALVSAGVIATQATLEQEHLSSDARAHGFDQINDGRAAIRQKAQELARKFWSQDAAKKVRTAAMGERVYEVLSKEPSHYLTSQRAVTDWVRQVAPAYARRPGRQRLDIPT